MRTDPFTHTPSVHGWVVDAQEDAETARAVGNRTYNELVELVISTMDDASIQRLQSASTQGSSSSFSAAAVAAAQHQLRQGSLLLGGSVSPPSAPGGAPTSLLKAPSAAAPLSEPPTALLLRLRLECDSPSGESEGPTTVRVHLLPCGPEVSASPPSMEAGGHACPSPGRHHQALLIRQFLESNCSQLTWCVLHYRTAGSHRVACHALSSIL